jgi:hypothetical protein
MYNLGLQISEKEDVITQVGRFKIFLGLSAIYLYQHMRMMTGLKMEELEGKTPSASQKTAKKKARNLTIFHSNLRQKNHVRLIFLM